MLAVSMTQAVTGAFIVPRNILSEDIPVWLKANATPSLASPDDLQAAIDKIMSLYPMIQVQVRHLAQEIKLSALGLGTRGNPRFVRHRYFGHYERLSLMGHHELAGDMHFQAIHRFWTRMRTTSTPTYVHRFSDPQANADPALGVFHTAELPYLFGSLSTSGPPKVANVTRAMRSLSPSRSNRTMARELHYKNQNH